MSDDQHIDALRDDIENTRGDMSQTIDQLQERLAPERLQQDTGEIVQEVADRIIAEIQGKTGDLTSGLSAQIQAAIHGAATAKSEELLNQATAGARTAGASLWQRVSQNPAPVALAALAVGLLAAGGKSAASAAASGDDGSETPGAVDGILAQAQTLVGRVTDAASAAGQQASGVVDNATNAMPSGSTMDGGHLHAIVGNQPVMAGLVAIGLGLAAGLALPQTEAERGTAAPLRERVHDRLSDMGLPTDPAGLIDRAKDQLGSLTEQAKTTATEGLAQTKQAATDLAQSAKQTASSAVSERNLIR